MRTFLPPCAHGAMLVRGSLFSGQRDGYGVYVSWESFVKILVRGVGMVQILSP